MKHSQFLGTKVSLCILQRRWSDDMNEEAIRYSHSLLLIDWVLAVAWAVLSAWLCSGDHCTVFVLIVQQRGKGRGKSISKDWQMCWNYLEQLKCKRRKRNRRGSERK